MGVEGAGWWTDSQGGEGMGEGRGVVRNGCGKAEGCVVAKGGLDCRFLRPQICSCCYIVKIIDSGVSELVLYPYFPFFVLVAAEMAVIALSPGFNALEK